MTNIWKKKSLTNPYYETAFHILGISRDVVSPSEINQKIEERRQAVRNMPGFYTIGDRAITEEDVTNAAQILSDPTRRILEELLAHNPEYLQVDEIIRLQKELKIPDFPEKNPPPRHLKFLLKAVQEFAGDFLKNLPEVEIPPRQIDKKIIPPFGLLEEDLDD